MANNTQSVEEKKAAKAKKVADVAAKTEAEALGIETLGAPPNGTPSAMVAEEKKEETLYALDVLAVENRVATWQAAALHRMMKWEDGKKVSKKDYAVALELLNKRPLGR